MQPHQERVVTEKSELSEKVDKLRCFIGDNPIFYTLMGSEQDRLKRQLVAMTEYLSILNERIAAFPNS